MNKKTEKLQNTLKKYKDSFTSFTLERNNSIISISYTIEQLNELKSFIKDLNKTANEHKIKISLIFWDKINCYIKFKIK